MRIPRWAAAAQLGTGRWFTDVQLAITRWWAWAPFSWTGRVSAGDCVIGAGALVTSRTEIPDGTLALGSPARVVRALTKEEIARNREYMLDYLNMSRDARDMQEEPDGHGRESGR